MLTHADLWLAIDALARRHGYSVSGLAKAAGLDPTTFNKSKRISDGKLRWPSTESLAKILMITNSSLGDLAGLIHGSDPAGAAPRTLPLIRLDHAEKAGVFTPHGTPDRAAPQWDAVTLPSDTDGSYALEVVGNTLNPVYRDGDRLLLVPHDLASGFPLRRGDRVVLSLRDGSVRVCELLRQTATRLTVRPLGATDTPEEELDVRALWWLARVVWASQ